MNVRLFLYSFFWGKECLELIENRDDWWRSDESWEKTLIKWSEERELIKWSGQLNRTNLNGEGGEKRRKERWNKIQIKIIPKVTVLPWHISHCITMTQYVFVCLDSITVRWYGMVLPWHMFRIIPDHRSWYHSKKSLYPNPTIRNWETQVISIAIDSFSIRTNSYWQKSSLDKCYPINQNLKTK